MTEQTDTPATPAEAKAALDKAFELGRQAQAAGVGSPATLAEAFHQEVRDVLYPKDGAGKLLPSRARGMGTLRSLQEKYVELGAKIEDLGVSPKGGVEPGSTIRDWYPPSR